MAVLCPIMSATATSSLFPLRLTLAGLVSVKAYPVPATNMLVVEAKGIESVILRGLDGKIVAQSVANTVNSDTIIINLDQNKPAAGLYLLCATTKTGPVVLKIPVE
ncbi:MAG: T9SS type A sorting domain-containing protein [Sphingobacteriales bacterium JAD_PAG50586_3]|nr:MAG: T9SS type A sorting domain-containing protein [Sphingobacteriales bacterium JAD_PAG50586_3]